MSRVSMLILLGIVNMLVPFSGLPVALRSLLVVVIGACVFSIGLSFRSRGMQAVSRHVQSAGIDSAAPDNAPVAAKEVVEAHKPSAV